MYVVFIWGARYNKGVVDSNDSHLCRVIFPATASKVIDNLPANMAVAASPKTCLRQPVKKGAVPSCTKEIISACEAINLGATP